MNTVIIEPCCAEKQLPKLLKNGEVVLFQTNGDVTFEHFIKALSCLAGDEINITVMAKVVDIDMMRVLAWLARRGWLKSLRVLTKEDESKEIYNEIHDVLADLRCFHHNSVEEDLLIIGGEKANVVLQGSLFSSPALARRFYAAGIHTVASQSFEAYIKPLAALMHKEDKPTTEAPAAEQPAEEGGVEGPTAENEEKKGNKEKISQKKEK